MQILQRLKDPAMLKTSGAILLILLSACYMGYSSFSKPASSSNLAWFTTDDGATFFADSADKLPPFDHNGKSAVLATVCSTDGGKTKKVAYLERFTSAGKAHLQDRIRAFKLKQSSEPPIAHPGESEVKLPGANNEWVSSADMINAAKIKSANVPTDVNATFEIVLP